MTGSLPMYTLNPFFLFFSNSLLLEELKMYCHVSAYFS